MNHVNNLSWHDNRSMKGYTRMETVHNESTFLTPASEKDEAIPRTELDIAITETEGDIIMVQKRLDTLVDRLEELRNLRTLINQT